MKRETEAWLNMAEDDLGAAKLALEHGFVRVGVFHSHEAVEKALKAIWIEAKGEEPERTHNLPYLAEELGLELADDQKEFLRKLYWQLIPSRYPEGSEPDPQTAQWYHDNARELFSWLRQKLT